MAKKITSKEVVVQAEKQDTSKLSGMVVIIATEKAQYMPTGKEYQVTAQLAHTLISKGYAKLKE